MAAVPPAVSPSGHAVHRVSGATAATANVSASRTTSTATRTVLRYIEQKWTDLQVERQGAYSVEHLESLNVYSKATSPTRVVLVCVLYPLPALLTALAVECLPLRPPSEGWRANWVFWIRILLVSHIVEFSIGSLMARFIPGLNFTFAKRLIFASSNSFLFVGTCVFAASEIGFPVPLMMQIGSIPIAVYALLMARLILGPALFTKDSPIHRHACRYNRFFSSVMALCGIFPIYKMLYSFLPVKYQLVAIGVLPIWKFAAKAFIVVATRELEDFMPMLVAFSVDFFSSLFISVCMSSSTSILLKLLFVAVDAAQSLLQLRAMKANGMELLALLSERKDPQHQQHQQSNDSSEITDLLPALLDAIQHSVSLPPKSLQTARLWACLPYSLTSEGLEQLRALDAADVYARRIDVEGTRQAVSLRRLHSRRTRNRSVAPSPAIAIQDDASISHTARSKEIVVQGLQLLFHSEYVVLVQYIECIVPLVYLIFKWAQEKLPNIAFYPGGAGNWDTTSATNIFVYAVLEVGLLLLINKVMQHKFALSPMYQLAHVLETEIYAGQFLLFGWILSLLQYELEHLGADLTLRFKWLEPEK